MKSWNELKWWTSKSCATTHTALNWHKYFRQTWYPQQRNVYRALHVTPFDKVRVVIVGQDPYPTPGVATGLAFSVQDNVLPNRFPPTLRNIFRELQNDLHIQEPKCGSLERWASQGVLLWNTSLTVEAGKSHFHLWKDLTDEVLSSLDEHRSGLVFVLWGKHAQSFLPRLLPSISDKRHHVILSAHPSPLSASRGFFGSRPFSTINSYLKQPIDWSL